ncbi:MAG TPA: class I SAM-dependent methyltransferase [Gammaproteobacteria bacterium]|nr:class I SAM-dependent methyltransferase [Gammaproteobacteria bacterium]
MIGATLFTWLQGAGFYRQAHQQAVEALPRGEGKTWLDVGTGPGLVARQAAARGYETTGMDVDAHMVRAAKRLARWQHSAARFCQGGLDELAQWQADVVSAASLLAVLDDKPAGIAALWGSVRPAGYLLVIEPTGAMNPDNAQRLIAADCLPKKRLHGLKMWAMARQGRAVDMASLAPAEATECRQLELLEGLLGGWIFRKAPAY